MHRFTSQRSSRRWPPVWMFVGLLVIALAFLAALYFLIHRRAGVDGAGVEAPARAKQVAYRNRALWTGDPAAAPAAPEEKPTIRGHVYGIDGNVIPGAKVIASTFAVAGNVLSTAGTALTDELGWFEFQLPEGTYQLNGSMDGYGATSATAQSGQTVSLVLPKSGVIEGHVQDERGEPVRRFAIDVISAVTADAPATPPLFSRTFESPDGSFRIDQLPSWEVVVRATAVDFAPAFSSPLTVRPEDSQKLDFKLSKGCALTGRVQDQSGMALPNVFVDAEASLAAGQVSELSVETAAQTQTEADGSFHLTAIPKGTVVVRGYDGSNAVSTVNVEVADCDKLEPVVLVMSPGGNIAGVARDTNGKPVVGARITLMHRPIGFVSTTSDAEGKFRFDQIAPGIVRMMMQHGDQVALTAAKVEEGKTAEQDVTLLASGTGGIRGRVTAGGKPLSSVQLMVVTNSKDGTLGLYYPITAEDGSYHVTALPTGVYLVSVVSTSTGDGVQVKPDEVTTLDLRVAPPPPARTPPSAPDEQPE